MNHADYSVGAARDLSYVAYEQADECPATAREVDINTSLKVQAVLPLPDDFKGNLTYDPESGRLFGISLGPPANAQRPSRLYEFDPATGEVLSEARLPLVGRFGNPVFRDGFIYQGVPHESRLYKISTGEMDFGRVVEHADLPTALDLDLLPDDLLRFTFIAFTGATWTPDQQLMIHSEDLGELITLNAKDLTIQKRVRTSRALRGIASVPNDGSGRLLLASADASDARQKIEERRFMFRGIHGIYELAPECLREGERTIRWLLIDADSGSTVARTELKISHAPAGSVSFVRHEAIPDTSFGRFTFMTTGLDGIEIIEWIPTRESALASGISTTNVSLQGR